MCRAQEGVWFEPMHCLNPHCMAPLEPYGHLGREKLRCSGGHCRSVYTAQESSFFVKAGMHVWDMFDSQCSMPVCREERLHVLAVIEGMIVPLRRDIAKSEPSPGVAHLGERGIRQKL